MTLLFALSAKALNRFQQTNAFSKRTLSANKIPNRFQQTKLLSANNRGDVTFRFSLQTKLTA
jgi:hypothetical protein